jgi:hypothetical protein
VTSLDQMARMRSAVWILAVVALILCVYIIKLAVLADDAVYEAQASQRDADRAWSALAGLLNSITLVNPPPDQESPHDR